MPRHCCVCGDKLSLEEEVFCAGCYAQLPFTDHLSDLYENEMAKLFWGRVAHFERAFALMQYHPHDRGSQVLFQLKYHSHPEVGEELGFLMGGLLRDKGFFDDIDAIVPVPLARQKEQTRGYNQSAMLALGLRRAVRLPIWDRVVRRSEATESQTSKDRMEREANVAGAFQLVDGDRLRGRHVLIVDDVVTTGATVCALAAELQRVAEVRVSVAAIALAGQG